MLTRQCNKDPLKSLFYVLVVKFRVYRGIHYVCSKTLWLLVRTASHVPIIYVLSKNKKKKIIRNVSILQL